MAEAATRSYFITGLKNAHALEKEALSIMGRQIDRLEQYPEMADRLRQHSAETEEQIRRLDAILMDNGESSSGLKDAALGFMGNMAALGHAAAADEVLKNSFANQAFENFEIASYRSLITIAEAGGFNGAIPLLQTTLREEEAMAAWCAESIPMVTRRFLQLKEAGEQASH
jgi:ferritin-like metal-binding protein YciE